MNICEFDDCMNGATVHVGNEPSDRHYCDKHAEMGLRKYLAQRKQPAAGERDVALCAACGLPEQEHGTPGVPHVFVPTDLGY